MCIAFIVSVSPVLYTSDMGLFLKYKLLIDFSGRHESFSWRKTINVYRSSTLCNTADDAQVIKTAKLWQ